MPQPLVLHVDSPGFKFDTEDDDLQINFDVATVSSSRPTNSTYADGETCPVWEAASYPMLKFSLVIVTVACVVPHKYQLSSLCFRLLFAVGCGVHLLWGLQICSPDIIFWNSLFFAVNLLHSSLLLIRLIPSRLSEENAQIYKQLFQIYETDKNAFQIFANSAKFTDCSDGDVYAYEQMTIAGMKLSLLIRGRIIVSYRGSFLYDIKPYEFLDCHEWIWGYRSEDHFDPRFQVTLTATENCRIMTWSCGRLEKFSESLPEFYSILRQVISKNSFEQLYSVIESKREEIVTTKLFSVSTENVDSVSTLKSQEF